MIENKEFLSALRKKINDRRGWTEEFGATYEEFGADDLDEFARWGYEQVQEEFRWHSIEESLPPYDEEVIALTDIIHGKQLSSARYICYAHRPNPKGYNGKSVITGEVSHYEPMTYNGWNIEGVKYWMPCPKIPE